MDRILNMIMRRVVGRLVNKGIDLGAEALARRSPAQGAGHEPDPDRARATARGAKSALRMARRIGRL